MSTSPKENKEEWLNRLRDSVSDYKESVPNDAWQKLERQMYGGKMQFLTRRRIYGGISAVAAIAIIFLILPTFIPDSNNKDKGLQIAVVNNNESVVAIADEIKSKKIIADSNHKNDKRAIVDNTGDIAKEIEVEKEAYNNEVVLSYNKQEYNKQEPNKQEPNKEEKIEEKKKEKELTWEEYLQQPQQKENKKQNKDGNWLAFSVGNNGVGTFGADNNVKPQASMEQSLQELPPIDINPVKDIVMFQRPSFLALPIIVEELKLENEPEYRHKQPLSFGITFGKNISSKFTVETGLVYSLLISDVSNLQKNKTVTQTLHYLGIPVRFNWNFINKNKYAVYTGAGVLIEKCIYGKIGDEKLSVKSVQTSLNFNVGAQYKFNKTVGIYFEPGLCYYLGMKDNGSLGEMKNGNFIKSIHSEHPFGFTLQAGLRFSF
ncbi:MAG: hypothetical protein RSA75_05355 [Bacteroidales bacterium]